MTRPTRPNRSARLTNTLRSSKRRLVIGAVLAAIAIGALAIGISSSTQATPSASGTTHPGAAGKLQDPVGATAPAARTNASATRVAIPAIGVDSTLIGLNLKAGTDQLEAPLPFSVAGWYVGGTVPGDIGPAVIDGHVDSPTGPGVFLHLNSLKAGDDILVTLSTGDVKTFVVTSKMAAPKNNFPTAAVYGPTPTPQLRLITCNGDIDPSTGKYLDNLVVFASLTT